MVKVIAMATVNHIALNTRGGHYYTCCTDTRDHAFWSRSPPYTMKSWRSPQYTINWSRNQGQFLASVKPSSYIFSENHSSGNQAIKAQNRPDQILIPVAGVSTAGIVVTTPWNIANGTCLLVILSCWQRGSILILIMEVCWYALVIMA